MKVHFLIIFLSFELLVGRSNGQLLKDVKTCGEAMIFFVKSQLKHIDPCVTELGLDKDPRGRSENLYCILKCVLKREGMLNEDGFPDISQISHFVTNIVPEFLFAKLMALVEKCRHTLGGIFLNPDEKLCKSYKKVAVCMIEHAKDMCKERRCST